MQPEDINQVTELTQQLLQAPINNLALFIAVLALFLLLGIVFVVYRFAPRFVKFLESLTTSYSKMVENLEKLEVIEARSVTTQANIVTEVGGLRDNIGTLLSVGSTPVQRMDAALDTIIKIGTPPVQRIETNVVEAVGKIDEVKDIAIATADLTQSSQEIILNALNQAVAEIKAAMLKRKTDSQPITVVTAENGEQQLSKVEEKRQ